MAAVLTLVALLAFGLGRLSVYYGDKGEFKVVESGTPVEEASE